MVSVLKLKNCKLRETNDIDKVVSVEIQDPKDTILYNLKKKKNIWCMDPFTEEGIMVEL